MEVVNNVDVFVSYQHEDELIVKRIVEALEKNMIKCWYAPRNIISGSYAKSICTGIENCKVFLLVLSDSSSNSQHVLNEVELAYKRLDSGIILMPFKITEEISNEEMRYYINRLQWINAVNIPLENAINDLISKLKPMFGIDDSDSTEKIIGNLKATKRDTNNYFDFEDKEEIDRLRAEGDLLFDLETSIYDRLFFGKNDLNVLDVNVLYAGNQAKLLYRKEVKSYVGLTYKEEAAEAYNKLYPQNDSRYYYLDIKNPNFDVRLKEIMKELSLQAFDLINLSMVILDLKDPIHILRKLRRFLKPGGMIYIRDIDDGLNLYFPDEDNRFKKLFELAAADPYSGFRESGRQIYSHLKSLGAKSINLELNGLSTVGMDYYQKANFYQSYLTFTKHEYERLVHENPNNNDYKKALQWLDENMPAIEDQFFDDSFLFIGGFIIYTAIF